MVIFCTVQVLKNIVYCNSSDSVKTGNKGDKMKKERLIWNGKEVAFEEKRLFDGRIAIRTPKDFEELSKERIREIYPLGSMPQVVLGNSYLDLFVGFRYTEHELPDASVGEFLAIVRVMLEQTGSRMQILSEKNTSDGGRAVSSLDLISHASEEDVYHKLFFCSLEGRALMGFINFSCSHNYQAVAEEMFQSFRFITE